MEENQYVSLQRLGNDCANVAERRELYDKRVNAKLSSSSHLPADASSSAGLLGARWCLCCVDAGDDQRCRHTF